jgi:hypothetical protein
MRLSALVFASCAPAREGDLTVSRGANRIPLALFAPVDHAGVLTQVRRRQPPGSGHILAWINVGSDPDVVTFAGVLQLLAQGGP